jgi:hypothetical protein
MAPLIFERRVPAFPSLTADDGDELKAAIIARVLAGMDEHEWRETVEIAKGLMDMPSFKGALTAVSGALLERGALTGDELKRIVDAERVDDPEGTSASNPHPPA